MREGLVAGAFLLLACMPALAEAQMIILVRHAERADGGATAATGMTGSPDPSLSEAGRARAARLATMLADAGVTAIYTTEYQRTRQTAAPLAAALGIEARMVPAREQASLLETLKAHRQGAVLVVGHSNTVPAIIAALGGPAVQVADDEYDNLFILAPGGLLTRVRFHP
jgi:broad specificity phosphatase PhoE